jgi:hypothetical protein
MCYKQKNRGIDNFLLHQSGVEKKKPKKKWRTLKK